MLKNIVFTYLALMFAQSLVLDVFVIHSDANLTLLLVVFTFFVVNVFFSPLYKTLSLPQNFVAALMLRLLINFLLVYTLPVVVSALSLQTGYLVGLNILGVVIPSTRLSLTAGIFAFALIFVLVFNFFLWLSSSGRKR